MRIFSWNEITVENIKKIILGCGLAEKAMENSDEIYTELLYL